jgi:cephalosporin-C deacetylase
MAARIYSKLIVPKNAEKCPAVLWFHGYSGKAPQWSELLAYAAQGFVVAAMDCRGQSGKSDDTYARPDHPLRGHIVKGLEQTPQELSFRNIFLDTLILANIVMDLEQVDPEKVCAKGGSQGGALTIACSALEPRIKKAAPAYPFLSDYKRVWQLDFRTAAYDELTDFFRRFDPLHKNEKHIFTRLGYIDIQHLAKWVKAETMMGISLRDNICPPSTQFAVYNKLNCKKKMLLYPDFGHEPLPDFEDMVFQWISDI